MTDPGTSDPQSNSQLLRRGQSGFETGVSVLKEQLKTMPLGPGVYRMINEGGDVLYVGKAKNLKKRVTSYTQKARLPVRLQRMVAQTRALEIVVTQTEVEALLLEANLIRKLLPPFNILLRDDKSYPYILITRKHPFPQIVKHRGAKTDSGWYFGPFASAASVNETLILLQRGFLLRNCSDNVFTSRKRPCLQYHIKRCTAPCVGKVSQADYAIQVDEARAFLKGSSNDIQKQLAVLMQEASDKLDYEKAAVLRDRISVLTRMQAHQDINVGGLADADIFGLAQKAGKTAIQAFFFRGDRNFGTRCYFPQHDKDQSLQNVFASFLAQFYADKVPPAEILLSHRAEDLKLLEEALTARGEHKVTILVPKLGKKRRVVDHAIQNAETSLARKLAESKEQSNLRQRLAEIFGLDEAPLRIEVYDNSHLGGQHAVGAMIVAGPEGFIKNEYRKYNIKDSRGEGDDYAMMDEVFRRRFRPPEEGEEGAPHPDLVLIDGGKGQLGRVRKVLEELGLLSIPCVAIAKGPDRNAGRERFFMADKEPLSLPTEDPALYYLQRLRDEAHRFVIGTHRAKRTKAISETGLDDIEGVGASRKRALLHHFGSGKAVAAAALEDLLRVPGISQNTAKKVHDYFREPS